MRDNTEITLDPPYLAERLLEFLELLTGGQASLGRVYLRIRDGDEAYEVLLKPTETFKQFAHGRKVIHE